MCIECKHCKKRYIGCHSKCIDYFLFKMQNDNKNDERRKMIASTAAYNGVTSNQNKLRKQHIWKRSKQTKEYLQKNMEV